LGAVERERTLMLSSISHDLRTPLAALRASIEAIRDGVALDPDASLHGMERQVMALGSLVDDLQLHTRLASGTLEMRSVRVDLTEIADEAVEVVRPLGRTRDVSIDLVATERVVTIGDPAQLARVLRNLLENAIRHAPVGSVVTIEVATTSAAVLCTVADQGDGFAPDIRARAFEPFTRGDPARDVATGTAGLGLAIAAGIVSAHRGAIRVVDSDHGVVEVALPCSGAPSDTRSSIARL
jgi:signal transduction histidine kinase